MKKALLILLFLLISISSYGSDKELNDNYFKGSSLLTRLNLIINHFDGIETTNKISSYDLGYTKGLIVGIKGALSYSKILSKRNLNCEELSNMDMTQLTRMIRKYLEENPNLLHYQDVLLIYGALSQECSMDEGK
ncbi:MAG: hypothetical protein K8S18_11325 [Desulfobacula sp.]|nr:hypothetical protein [Desulfobacula sp.]